MSRRLKGFKGLHFSLSKMHRSYEVFTGLAPAQRTAWVAFDSINSRRINFRGTMPRGRGGSINLI